MTQQLKELAEQMLKLQQVVKMLSDNVTEMKRGTDIDIRVLNDAVADNNDTLSAFRASRDRLDLRLEKHERLLNDLCDDVSQLIVWDTTKLKA